MAFPLDRLPLHCSLEAPILLIGLSLRHRLRNRLLAAIWVNACTYPIVVLVLPYLVWVPFGRIAYLAVAETFAPVAECSLFWLAFGSAQLRFRISMYHQAPRRTTPGWRQ